MTKKLIIGFVLAAIGVGLAYTGWQLTWTDRWNLRHSRGSFAVYPIPYKATQLLFDLGVVDVDANGFIDVYTVNHNYRQDLLLADGKGGYRDMLSALGLDQNPEFPAAEISLVPPQFAEPGVYVYWSGRTVLSIRAYRIGEAGRVQGSLRTYTPINRTTAKGFSVEAPVVKRSDEHLLPESQLRFASSVDGELDLDIETPGTPIFFELDAALPPNRIYVGNQKVSPRSNRFEMRFQDRHGMAWSDYNDDGRLDLFATRGALSGQLRMIPKDVADDLKDELFVSRPSGNYENVATELGIVKNGCSGRKANWVDFDGDGLLDIFINCQDRGNVKGVYPKQLYRQTADHRFVEVAAAVGLDMPDHEVIDFVWLDVDGDGYPDLLTSETTGFYLYRNKAGKSFDREFIGRGKFIRADNPTLRGIMTEYWFVDGKLSVGDFDGDGNFDVFSASKTGNTLLVNRGKGKFDVVDPTTLGLPEASVTAAWVDFDNDGRLDLYALPQGLLRQRPDHRFEATSLLTLAPHKHMAAIANWADFDNDGRRDLILASLENFSQWKWWERAFRSSEDRFTWSIVTYRNLIEGNHWVELKLVGKPGNREAIGARVTLRTADGTQTQQVGQNDGAFFSQGHYRLYFGLGTHPQADSIDVRWPDGTVQRMTSVAADRILTISQDPARSQ